MNRKAQKKTAHIKRPKKQKETFRTIIITNTLHFAFIHVHREKTMSRENSDFGTKKSPIRVKKKSKNKK